MSQQCGNPLLRDWVKEWMDEAKRMQMKSYYTYKKAYDALCRCPNTFEHPSQAQKLEGIGQIMAKRLTEKMIEYCQNNDLPVPLPVKGKRKRGEQDDSTEQSSSQSSRSRAPKTYVPTFRAYKDKVGNSKTAYLISYPVYNQINSKNGSTSLHEIYLRMLTCIRGVNAEKALALMRVYPTPYSLLSAFQNKDEHDAKNLAYEATQTQINRRKWGPQLSERLYQVWGASEYSNTEALSD
ncbi:hypothetical protein RMCBS344292_13153 [Rhizopus microsporus]|nr:hypothetical protein RMCBS344292_13153 [Rhizopus microsporus]